MWPSPTVCNFPSHIPRNAVLFADSKDYFFVVFRPSSRTMAKREARPNILHLIYRESGLSQTVTQNHIFAIIFVCSWVGMVWVNARRIVAIMKETFTAWYRAFNQFPCNTMSAGRSSPIPYASVLTTGTIRNAASSPNPTTAKTRSRRVNRAILINLIPKAFRNRDGFHVGSTIYLPTALKAKGI